MSNVSRPAPQVTSGQPGQQVAQQNDLNSTAQKLLQGQMSQASSAELQEQAHAGYEAYLQHGGQASEADFLGATESRVGDVAASVGASAADVHGVDRFLESLQGLGGPGNG